MRLPILSFPAKRANRAMLTSTMRWAFETTMERRRDHDGAPPEPGEPMSRARVVPLDAVGLLLAGVALSDRQEHVIDGVVIRAVEPGAPAPQALDEAPTGGFVTTAAFPVHQPP